MIQIDCGFDQKMICDQFEISGECKRKIEKIIGILIKKRSTPRSIDPGPLKKIIAYYAKNAIWINDGTKWCIVQQKRDIRSPKRKGGKPNALFI